MLKIQANLQWLIALIQQNHIFLSRAIAIPAVLGIAAIAVYLPQSLQLLLVGLPFVAGGAIFLLSNFRWGIVALIPAALVVPLDIGTGTGTSINSALLLLSALLGIWFAQMFIRDKQFTWIPTSLHFPLIAMLLISVLAFLVGQLSWFPTDSAPLPAQLGGLSLFFFSAGAFLIVVNHIDDVYWLKWLTWSLIVIGAVHIVGQAIPFLSPLGRIVQNGAIGSLFWTWLTAVVFAQFYFNDDLPKEIRAALLILLAGIFYVGYVIYGDWKSGWLPPLAVVAVLVGVRSWRFGILLGILAAIPASSLMTDVIATDQYSFSTRLEAVALVLEMSAANPILGFGPANYYFYTPLFPIRGWYVQFNSHNQFADLIAQTGVLGLLSFLAFFIMAAFLAWRLRERVPRGFARAYVFSCFGGIIGTLVAASLGDWVIPFVYNIGLRGFRASILAWLFIGGLVVLEQLFPKGTQLNK